MEIFKSLSSGVFTSGLLLCATLSFATAQQPGFRIETDILFGDDNEPAKQTLTLFSEGVYYDFSVDDPTAITMIDPQRNRIVLLDAKRNIQTVLDTNEMHKYVESARLQANSPDLQLLLKASEQFSFDERTGKCTVGIPQMQYIATSQQPTDEKWANQIAAQYADFANWSARLNAVYPPQRPPYVRMRLNDELASRGLLPAEIEITTKPISGKPMIARCRLLAIWKLSSDDHAKIKSVGEKLAQFNKLESTRYFAEQLTLKQSR